VTLWRWYAARANCSGLHPAWQACLDLMLIVALLMMGYIVLAVTGMIETRSFVNRFPRIR
jgi:hypothetical protein